MGNAFSVHRLLNMVHKRTLKKFRHKLEPYEFTRGEFPFLLHLLREGDGVTQKDICERIPISKGTTSKMINNLVDKGYLRKERDQEDRRATRIYLTEKKEELEGLIQDIDREAEETLLRGFDEGEKKELHGYLERILKNLEGENGQNA